MPPNQAEVMVGVLRRTGKGVPVAYVIFEEHVRHCNARAHALFEEHVRLLRQLSSTASERLRTSVAPSTASFMPLF